MKIKTMILVKWNETELYIISIYFKKQKWDKRSNNNIPIKFVYL